MERAPRLTVLSGPSGVGKGTVIRHLCKRMPELKFSVSYTTRQPRPGEIDGVHYNFVTYAEFEARIADGTLLEWARFNVHYYGTPRPPTDGDWLVEIGFDLTASELSKGQGAVAVKRNFADATLVWITPPGRFQLLRLCVLATRLARRGTDGPRKMLRRLKLGYREMRIAPPFYDHVIVNYRSTDTARAIQAIIAGSS